MFKRRLSPPMLLALIFLLFGTFWIMLTDFASLYIAHNNFLFLSRVQTYKGVLFMTISAALIFFVSRKVINKQNVLQDELNEERLRYKNELAREVFNAQEQERKKLGEELHDNINQLLGVVKLYIEHAQMNPAAKEEMLSKSSDYLKQVINEIRTLSKSLVSPTLSDLGLIESIKELSDSIVKIRDMDITIHDPNFGEDILDATQKLMLYRITQEQLNNILKHSKAEHVAIQLMKNGRWVQLVIHDDGVGFNQAHVTAGLGLKNIRHRLELYNGQMKIETSPEEGCRLVATFQLG
jgi:signal transduction histidine kinase